MAGIWVLRGFPCDITTSHVTEGESPFLVWMTGIVSPWSNLPTFKDDGPNSALCEYHSTIPLGFGVLLVQIHGPAACSGQQNGVLSCHLQTPRDPRWQPPQPSLHGFNQSPPGFQATGSMVLLSDSIWRFFTCCSISDE